MEWILFFDGDCGFCSRSVRLVARLDKRKRISFAPLQGELARGRGLSHHAAADGGSMVVARESDGRIFTGSDSWVGLALALGGGWVLFSAVRFIPKGIRDACYRWIARNRYRLAGKADACALPDPEMRKRLLD